MKAVRFISLFALVFLALTSVVGAIPMLTDPHGQPWQMPQSFLAHSPFHSYLIPGIVLLVMDGLMSMFVCVLVLRRRRGYGLWIAFQGCVLFGWLAVECMVLRMVIWAHYVYGAVALILVLAGLWLRADAETGNEWNELK
jgi:hypothetical protein